MTISPLRTNRLVISLSAVATAALMATSANAIPRSMTGILTVENPSAGNEGRGQVVSGETVEVAGTTPSTFVGREVAVAQSQFNFSGLSLRDFPDFGNVANLVKSFNTIQNAATLAENNGALAVCPGADGCVTGTSAALISFCPPGGTPAQTGAPGTASARIGNWTCTNWAAAGTGNRGLRLAISNASGRPNFGGTLTLLRNQFMNVWRVEAQPTTPNAPDAEVSRSFMDVSNRWGPGLPNFSYTPLSGMKGPKILARLNARGAVAETFGCVNGVGTLGVGPMGTPGEFNPAQVRVFRGSNCGTEATEDPPGQAWGFKATTGTLSGSDFYPFSLSALTLGGTVFNPFFVRGTAATQANGNFFFSRMGTDAITPSGDRNLVLLGGGLAYDPSSFNAFFRISRLKMAMHVPEPGVALGMLAGVGALAGLARRRYKA